MGLIGEVNMTENYSIENDKLFRNDGAIPFGASRTLPPDIINTESSP